ncbi:hypothetical protein C1H46_039905 [Malus baccata]|uniref:Uncharacterized protein n=1 Tax=Malus baccata TaxID=106549 RepID=A0A540KK22_MALBA|nr:hypothetical protein C1H46_039905 [Malus baccata]
MLVHMLTISESSVKSSSSSLMRHRSYYYKAIVAGRSGSKDSTDTSVSCPDQANPWDTEYEEAASRGLLYQRPMDVDVYLNCHQRKLQILTIEIRIKHSPCFWHRHTRKFKQAVLEFIGCRGSEGYSVSQVKNWIDQSGDSCNIVVERLGDYLTEQGL